MSLSVSARLTSDVSPLTAHQILMPSRGRIKTILLYVLWLAIGIWPIIDGLGYYLSPFTERPYNDLHELYKPSGFIGQGLGIIGTLMMFVGVVSYMLRKRWSFMHRFGKLKSWLTFHIFLCTLGPFLILLHTTFKFGNIASISFWSMAVVVGSGVFGRYVYVRIPKTVNGQFLSKQVIEHAQSNLVQRIAKQTSLSVAQVSSLTQATRPSKRIVKAVFQSVGFEMKKRGLANKMGRQLEAWGVNRDLRKWAVPLLVDNAHLQLRTQIMQPFIRAFGYWHVLHIPLALVMLVALIVHIGVAIAFGYTWIF